MYRFFDWMDKVLSKRSPNVFGTSGFVSSCLAFSAREITCAGESGFKRPS